MRTGVPTTHAETNTVVAVVTGDTYRAAQICSRPDLSLRM